MKLLVTGAAGRLGSRVCHELLRSGHEVLGTDQRLAALGVPLQVADLRDPHAVYPLLEGREAVVHLGNVPSLSAGASPQAVLSDNVSMNANVFRAALDVGVRRIVFASSLQAMIRLDDGKPALAPYTVPYFPLDGAAPPNPGNNFYGLSKELGERLLRVLSERHPELACTALRFPMLTAAAFHARVEQPQRLEQLNFCEGLTYLDFDDAARLIGVVLERQLPGYHQYFPAQALNIAGYSAAALVAEFFPRTPLRCAPGELTALVDLTALERDFGFRPSTPLTVRLRRT
jgi:nucleoside-diphosphate-sugar epimerase